MLCWPNGQTCIAVAHTTPEDCHNYVLDWSALALIDTSLFPVKPWRFSRAIWVDALVLALHKQALVGPATECDEAIYLVSVRHERAAAARKSFPGRKIESISRSKLT